MRRWATGAAVTLVCIGHAHLSVAQVSFRPADGQSAPVAGHIGPAPSPDRSPPDLSGNQPPSTRPPFISTLSCKHPACIEQVPVPFRAGARVRPFAFLTVWPWDGLISAPTTVVTPVMVLPLQGGPVGGLQIDVQPWRAQVYVDGAYAGLVEDFSGYYHHLELVAGPHVIAVVAPGYEPLILDVLTVPGRTTTYRDTLTRAPAR